MANLQDVALKIRNEQKDEMFKEIEMFHSSIEKNGNIVGYDIDLFNRFFYIPFRAYIHFNIDSIIEGSKIKNDGEPTSSLFNDWLAICLAPSNKVALRTKKGKIVTILPEFIKVRERRADRPLTESDVLTNALHIQVAQMNRNERDFVNSQEAIKDEIMESFRINERDNSLSVKWFHALNEVDKYNGKETISQIIAVANYLKNIGIDIPQDKIDTVYEIGRIMNKSNTTERRTKMSVVEEIESMY